MSTEAEVQGTLRSDVRRGAAWSAVSTLTLRLGTFALGIVLARVLGPEQFGVYAVALTVQTVLITLADFGLSADVIRSDDPERRAPTVAALGLVSGAVLALGMAASAPLLADSFGVPEAAPVVAVLAVTLVLGGAGVVPYGMLVRRFEQRRLFAIAAVDFVLSTTLTLLLLRLGWGVMALAVARVVTQAVVLVLQHVLAGVRPNVRVDRALVRPVLMFGGPVALANLLSWSVLNVDNLVIARMLGPVALGSYVLAFNVSSWPMTAIGQVVRSVALPGFARVDPRGQDTALRTSVALTWTLALPAGVMLAVLAAPLVEVLYGARWLPAGHALAALGVFGAVRVLFDVFAAFLYARGDSLSVLWIQVAWLVLLVPAVIVGASADGLRGAAWSHVIVSLAVVLPAYLWALRRVQVRVGPLLRALVGPTLAILPAALAGAWAASIPASPPVALLVGGAAGALVYGLLLHRTLRALLHRARATSPPSEVVVQ